MLRRNAPYIFGCVMVVVGIVIVWNYRNDRTTSNESANKLATAKAVAETPKQVVEPNHGSPESLLRSVFDGRRLEDVAFLARTLARTHDKAELTLEDLAVARIQLLKKDGYWEDLEDALERDTIVTKLNGNSATMELQLGGAVGTIRLIFIQLDLKWYLNL